MRRRTLTSGSSKLVSSFIAANCTGWGKGTESTVDSRQSTGERISWAFLSTVDCRLSTSHQILRIHVHRDLGSRRRVLRHTCLQRGQQRPAVGGSKQNLETPAP